MLLELNKLILQRYIIYRHLASGGMADIYEASDVVINKPVALKFLKEKSLNNDYEIELFKNEARFLAMFNHPHIMKIYNVGEYEGVPFVSNELLKGKSLKEVLDNRSRLSFDETLDYMLQILDAVSHIHELNVIHNDLKPDNILLLSDGNIKLCDFGIATHTNEKNFKEVFGSPNYLAPEVLQSRKYSIQSDIYSLGVMLFEFLTGKLPYLGNNSKEVLQAHLSEEFPSIKKYISLSNADDLDFVLSKACARSIGNRYKSINEFRLDLEKIKRHEPLKNKSLWKRIFG